MSTYSWRFFTAGGFDQVRLDRGADLAHLAELDQKLWVALSCPVRGVEFDPRTLELVDSDHDGHIRAQELIDAIDWALRRLTSPDDLLGSNSLPLAHIRTDTPEGQTLLASAQRILAGLGKTDAQQISADDTADSARILAALPANGDGVITPATEADPIIAAAMNDMLSVVEGKADCVGVIGLSQQTCEQFFAESRQWLDWLNTRPDDLSPLDDESGEAAYQALAAVAAKVDDFFLRCQLAAYDPDAASPLNAGKERYQQLSTRNLAEATHEVAELPLAFVSPNAQLPLQTGLNPAWRTAIAALHDLAVAPLLGAREYLSEADWRSLQARFARTSDWLAAQPTHRVGELGEARLTAMLDSDLNDQLQQRLAADLAVADQAQAIADVDRLVRYVRDLATLANNMVSFRDFYNRSSPDDLAIFQAGTLYLDGRSCQLCVKVLDPGKHASLAGLSGVYLAYCDCQRGSDKMTIAAAFTAGDADQLMIGRNGIFYDRDGKDWDATITRIVDHPISIRQAFWAPYKKAARLIGEQLQKFAAARAKAVEDMTHQAITDAGKKVETAKPNTPPPAPVDAARFAGIFAAVGLAVGAIGTALASVVTGFMGLKFWQMPLALGGLALLISGPSIALAYFKLRNRNLGPILDANGWAVNARAKINIPFGTALTQLAKLPEGASRSLTDPFADKRRPWRGITLTSLFLLALLTGAALMLGWI